MSQFLEIKRKVACEMSARSPRTPRTLVFSSSSVQRQNISEDCESKPPDSESQKLGDCEKEFLQSKYENNGTFDTEIIEAEFVSRDECAGDCGLRGREIALHVAVLEAKLSDETQAKNRLSLAILEKNKEIEILKLEKQESDLKCEDLKEQLEISSKHLDTIEISFNDVHEKYERAKQTIQILNQNIDTLKESIAEHDLCIGKKHEQFLKLKEHAMERMDFANSQLDLIERKYSFETSKLRASLREAELDARSLSEQLEQRNKDNAELSSICDGLIERMQSQNNITSDHADRSNDPPILGEFKF